MLYLAGFYLFTVRTTNDCRCVMPLTSTHTHLFPTQSARAINMTMMMMMMNFSGCVISISVIIVIIILVVHVRSVLRTRGRPEKTCQQLLDNDLKRYSIWISLMLRVVRNGEN